MKTAPDSHQRQAGQGRKRSRRSSQPSSRNTQPSGRNTQLSSRGTQPRQRYPSTPPKDGDFEVNDKGQPCKWQNGELRPIDETDIMYSFYAPMKPAQDSRQEQAGPSGEHRQGGQQMRGSRNRERADQVTRFQEALERNDTSYQQAYDDYFGPGTWQEDRQGIDRERRRGGGPINYERSSSYPTSSSGPASPPGQGSEARSSRQTSEAISSGRGSNSGVSSPERGPSRPVASAGSRDYGNAGSSTTGRSSGRTGGTSAGTTSGDLRGTSGGTSSRREAQRESSTQKSSSKKSGGFSLFGHGGGKKGGKGK